MSQQYLPGRRSPLATAFAALVGLGSLVLMIFVGLTVGAVLLVAGLLVAAWFKVRLWLARRRGDLPPRAPRSDGDVFEGQYTVLDDPQRPADREPRQ